MPLQVANVMKVTSDSQWRYGFDVDSLPQALAYDGSGNLSTITAGPDEQGNSYRQTLTYTSSKLSNISAWVKL